MDFSLGLLSVNKEVIRDIGSNGKEKINLFTSIDSIKFEILHLLLIDIAFFNEIKNVQFFLSKIRKKADSLPVLLILHFPLNYPESVDWFYDDIIIYPFREGELKLRAKYLLAKSDYNDEKSFLSAGKVLMNIKEYSVFFNGEKMNFTYKEFELLRIFLANKGQVFTRSDLLKKIWGVDYIGGTRTVDVHVRRLRGKLGSSFNSIIETVRNIGYRCKND